MQVRRMICAAFACILAVGTLAIPASAIETASSMSIPAITKSLADSSFSLMTGETVADDNVVYYGINELNPDDFIYIAPATVQRARTSYIRFEFPGAVYNSVYSDFIENVITAGSSAILNVNTCVWAPESNNLEIGIYNWTTAENWYVVKSGGQVMNDFITFTNLTAGSYSVYIRNRGTSSLTTGYLLYHLR